MLTDLDYETISDVLKYIQDIFFPNDESKDDNTESLATKMMKDETENEEIDGDTESLRGKNSNSERTTKNKSETKSEVETATKSEMIITGRPTAINETTVKIETTSTSGTTTKTETTNNSKSTSIVETETSNVSGPTTESKTPSEGVTRKENKTATENPLCGLRRGCHLSRITNGRTVKLGCWPWHVGIGFKDSLSKSEIKYHCGGALITNRHVVTAAHCTEPWLLIDHVILGEQTLFNDDDGAKPEKFKVLKKIQHPSYDRSNNDADIAVLELDREVVFRKDIQPICLPSVTPSLRKEDLLNKTVKIAGWGTTSFEGSLSSELLFGYVQVYNRDKCRDKFKNLTSNQICAIDMKGKVDACQGDSGGPMVVGRVSTDGEYRYHLIGITSYGHKCNSPGIPGVYTKVNKVYEKWINTIINQ